MSELTSREAARIISNADGIRIIGRTPMAVRHGAYTLLEKLGVRWFFKHPAWTVVPGSLNDPGAFDAIYEPDFYWRLVGQPSLLGQSDYANWATRNKLPGAELYPVWSNYETVLDFTTHWFRMTAQQKLDYYNAHPDYFLPNNRYPTYPSQLNFDNPDMMQMAINYVKSVLDSAPSTPGWNSNDALRYGVASFSPNDAGGWDPPYPETNIQLITDVVFGWTNTVAAAIRADYPGKLVGVYSYAYNSATPSIPLQPNMLVVVATAFNWGGIPNRQRVRDLVSKGVQVGWYDYFNVWAWGQDSPGIDYNLLNNIKWLASEGASHYMGESTTSWGGGAGIQYYIGAKLLWDSSLNISDLMADFYAKAFGPAAIMMQYYYETRSKENVPLAHSFDALHKALVLASGNQAVLTRIHHLEDYTRFLWKWHNVGIRNLSLSDLEAFYTFICKIRDEYMVEFVSPGGAAEPDLRAELITRGLSDAQVTALQDFTPPSDAERATWLSEAMTAFSAYMPAPDYINIKDMELKPLGDTFTPLVAPLYTAETHDILVYSAGNENVTILAKTDMRFALEWYSPAGEKLATWRQVGALDWTSHDFPAPVPGYYHIYATRFSYGTTIDVPNRPASVIADFRSHLLPIQDDPTVSSPLHTAPQYWNWRGAQTQYFYVPPGTSIFAFASTVDWAVVSGSLVDPQGVSHNFNWVMAECPYTDSNTGGPYNEMVISGPVPGLWRLTINSNPNWNFFWLTGIPPLVWHDPQYLLIPVAVPAPEPPPPDEGNALNINTIAVLSPSDEFVNMAAQELKTYLEQISGQIVTIIQGDVSGPAIRLELAQEAAPVTLNLTVEGNGTTDPAPGSWVYDTGTVVPIAAIPLAGARFVQWMEAGVPISTEPQINIALDQNRDIVAVFEDIVIPPMEYAITISVIGQGTTNPAVGAYTVEQGTSMTIEATPATGWNFDHWEGDVTGTQLTASVLVDANMSIVAVFAEIPPPPPSSGSGKIVIAGVALIGIITAIVFRRKR